jgi:hypothetical protein
MFEHEEEKNYFISVFFVSQKSMTRRGGTEARRVSMGPLIRLYTLFPHPPGSQQIEQCQFTSLLQSQFLPQHLYSLASSRINCGNNLLRETLSENKNMKRDSNSPKKGNSPRRRHFTISQDKTTTRVTGYKIRSSVVETIYYQYVNNGLATGIYAEILSARHNCDGLLGKYPF